MRMMATLGTMGAALLLSGCLTSAEYAAREAPKWSRADSTPEGFVLERKACVDEVELGLYDEDYVDPLFPQGPAGRRLAAMDWAREAYVECMYSKGWVLAQGARVGAPGEIYYP